MAQYLISLGVELSDALKLRVIETGQLGYVLGCYLSTEADNIVQAVSLLSYAIKAYPQARENHIEKLVKTNPDSILLLQQAIKAFE